MVDGVRFADLQFRLHGFLSAADLRIMRSRFGEPSDRETPVVIERADAVLPNGRHVSVLRGMKTVGAAADFETCRMFDCADGLQPVKHRTIESVQQELDAVAAMPPL